jgi:Holliday junction resolvasome RuvABC endonuclease subunit
VSRTRLLPRPIDPDPGLLAVGTVLAFDATLTNTGWSAVRNDGRRIEVLAAGCHSAASQRTSHEGSFDKGTAQLSPITSVLAAWGGAAEHIVCERPAVSGYRTESAFLAAFCVHLASGGRAVLVSRQHVLSLLLGPGRHTKAAARTAAHRWIPERGGARFNEHIADAELAAITHLFDLAHGGGTA